MYIILQYFLLLSHAFAALSYGLSLLIPFLILCRILFQWHICLNPVNSHTEVFIKL